MSTEPNGTEPLPVEIDGWTLTAHARERAEEMSVTVEEITRCLSRSALQNRTRKYPGAMVRAHGEVALAVDPRVHEIITVLWNTPPGVRLTRNDPPPRRRS